MKTFVRNALAAFAALLLAGCVSSPTQMSARKVLVVTLTEGFHHSSIPTAEKIIEQLGKDSGAFDVEFARVNWDDPKYAGADGKPDKTKMAPDFANILAEKMSPQALKKYDAVIFANTTGELPIPDKQAFLDWIKSGKGFVGMHSATDTFHKYPPFIDMIGGEFLKHGAQVSVDAINLDNECPACRHLPATWNVFDEIYQFKNFDPAKVHSLLTLDKHPNDKTPGNYPVSWCKQYGKGRVFYTSLGHREDIWDPNTPANFERKNSKEIAEAYQKHILNGIKWAAGMEHWDLRSKVE